MNPYFNITFSEYKLFLFFHSNNAKVMGKAKPMIKLEKVFDNNQLPNNSKSGIAKYIRDEC